MPQYETGQVVLVNVGGVAGAPYRAKIEKLRDDGKVRVRPVGRPFGDHSDTAGRRARWVKQSNLAAV